MIGLLALACALGMKWMKWPGGSAMLIISGLLATVGALVRTGRDADRGLVMTMRLAMAAVVYYAVWRLLYWPGAVVVGTGAIFLSISALLLWWRSEQTRTWKISVVRSHSPRPRPWACTRPCAARR